MRPLSNVVQLTLNALVHTPFTRQVNVARASLSCGLCEFEALVQGVRTNHVDHDTRLRHHRLDAVHIFS